jgi:heterotetrameric sarcosine oxidase delta subunit
MLLIRCPWCGPRDEIEFRYGGQAGLTYPADPEALSDEEWADYLFMRDNPKGRSVSAGSTPQDAGDGSTP